MHLGSWYAGVDMHNFEALVCWRGHAKFWGLATLAWTCKIVGPWYAGVNMLNFGALASGTLISESNW